MLSSTDRTISNSIAAGTPSDHGGRISHDTMAEVAAGAGAALAAEQVLSTTVQLGGAGYFLTTPTQPLKATFTRIATAHDDELKRRSLTRSSHSVTIVNDKAYIFGGSTADGEVATNDIHVVNLALPDKQHEPDYQLIPAIPSSEGAGVPGSRTKHSACAFDFQVAVYGGSNESGYLVNENSRIWLFNPENKSWSALQQEGSSGPTPGSREGAKTFAYGKSILLYGGTTSDGRVSSDLWRFDTETKSWHALPNPPSLAAPTNAALADDHLYLIASSDPVSSELNMLPLKPSNSKEQDGEPDLKWTTLTFPTNPLAPGPQARHNGALLPITTGYGRNYLVYLLGARVTTSPDPPSASEKDANPTQWSDTWVLQLPSSSLQPKPALSLGDALKPAHIKDVIRSGVGADSGKWSWAEVEVNVPSELGANEGKLHPGPRALFGADVQGDGRSVVFWGGVDAEGNAVGDGWVLRL
ncbi:galactose oxidase, partial [Byssothecium circinans]